MFQLVSRLLSLIKESAMSDTKLRATHLQAYFVLFSSLLYSVTFVVIEIANAVQTLWKGQHYVPSNESIVVLGLLLSHHLGILFSKPAAYKPTPAVLVTNKTTEQSATSTTPDGTVATATTTQTVTAVPLPTGSVDNPDAEQEEYAEAI